MLFSAPAGVRTAARRQRRELQELLAASDFISLHVPLTPQTRHLIEPAALGKMKEGAILVNTSRGAVVDSAALIEALRSGALAAAGLDVYEGEPQVPEALRELPNTVLLPHVGSATAATRDAMATSVRRERDRRDRRARAAGGRDLRCGTAKVSGERDGHWHGVLFGPAATARRSIGRQWAPRQPATARR